MKCDCFCCYKKYICIFMCCSCSCIPIKPMRKKKRKRRVKKLKWGIEHSKEYPVYPPSSC